MIKTHDGKDLANAKRAGPCGPQVEYCVRHKTEKPHKSAARTVCMHPSTTVLKCMAYT